MFTGKCEMFQAQALFIICNKINYEQKENKT